MHSFKKSNMMFSKLAFGAIAIYITNIHLALAPKLLLLATKAYAIYRHMLISMETNAIYRHIFISSEANSIYPYMYILAHELMPFIVIHLSARKQTFITICFLACELMPCIAIY